jgi:rhamnose transport system ATP-binding protein
MQSLSGVLRAEGPPQHVRDGAGKPDDAIGRASGDDEMGLTVMHRRFSAGARASDSSFNVAPPPRMPTPPLLELHQLEKSFGGARALRGVDFDLRAGEVHALLGENGAGKSTLIKIVTGAHQPDRGTIKVAGEAVSGLTPAAAHKLGIACIYQQPALFPDLTVAENIAVRLEPGRAVRKVDWSARRTRAQTLLHRIGAAISPDAEVRTLSMPEQQLVEIACALGAGARIVIMDEPTASLTQKEQHLLFSVVRDLRNGGVGVIYISHRLEEIFALADRVTVLRDGESVGTNVVSTMTETSLIRMMVGREMTHIYPPREAEPGDVVLALNNVGCTASSVHDVTFDVRVGEVFGLAGLVGAGRTELARILFGITPADVGEIRLSGESVRPRSPQEAVAHGIAYVPEDRRRHGVVLEMPIEENITMAVHRRLFRGTWLRFGAERSLALDFIRDLAVKCSGPHAPGGSLSGGNQQKVSLARWLATKPRLLILDEPTQGVDVGAKSEIHKIVRRLAKDGLAVLLISSDLPEVLGMSDRIGVMRGGTVTAIMPGKSDAHAVMAAALGQAVGGPP